MSTARDLIKATLKKIGVIAGGETPSSQEETDAFAELNRMLASWSTKNLLVYGITIESFSTVASQQAYTLGDGGDWDTTRPIRTDAVFFRYDSATDIKVRMIDNKLWGQINPKNLESDIPSLVYIDNNNPLKTAYLFPIPNAVKTIILHNYRQLSSIAGLATTLQFPPGYEDAILYNLAIRLCPDYGKSASSEIVTLASAFLSDIKRANIRNVEIGVDAALLGGGASFDYRTGE